MIIILFYFSMSEVPVTVSSPSSSSSSSAHTPLHTSHSSPNLRSSPRSALKGSRGSKLDIKIRWDESQLSSLEQQQKKRVLSKRLRVVLPLAVVLSVVLIYLFKRWMLIH